MMRFATSAPLRGGASTSSAFVTPVRHVRYANIQEALKPIAGQSAGQMSILNEICCNPDAEEERRKPVFRCEVAPHVEATQAPSTYLRTMYEWGYNSLTLFKKTNEDPGPWWNANSSTLVSNWSQVGDYANAGMWSGVWRYTYGIGEYNMRPWEVRGRAWGRKDKKSGAVAVRYGLAKAKPLQKLMFPHTPEHAQHRRIKHPASAGCREISALHGKRILREVQYHLGQGIRFYLVDGVFGSDPATCTPYRIITDNPTHAYFASLAAIRTFNYVARQEITLVKRVSQSPIDEWGWRRPGVLVYHAPSYDFEAPRIVEEFGGPRPQDLSLEHARFVAVEPYSIPMKAVIGGEPSCDVLLDTTALLCARWGFYADDKAFITLPGDSILAPDGTHATLIISAGGAEDVDALRASPHLLGARHHRLANGRLSRAWDVSSATTNAMSAGAQTTDLVEEDLAAPRTQRVLPTRMGLPRSTSHRIFGRRNVSEYGFKHAHRYTDNAAEAAYAGGHLFSAPEAAKKLAAHPPRPSALDASMVDVVIIGTGKDASSAIIEVLKQRGMLYAEEEPLKAAMEKEMKGFRRVSVVAPAEAKTLIANLAKNGKA